MTWARTYALRFRPYEVSKVASTYGGAGGYGDFTYGQEATDPLSNVEATLAPAAGDWPNEVGWVYRIGETGALFQAVVLTLDGAMGLSAFTSAALILERASTGDRVVLARPLELTEEDTLEYEWGVEDLVEQGVYRVLVQLVAESGRPMTVSANDSATLIVRAGA